MIRIRMTRLSRVVSRYSLRTLSTSNNNNQQNLFNKNKNIAYYTTALVIGVFGAAYASVPLYKLYCTMTGYGGATKRAEFNPSDVQSQDNATSTQSSLKPIKLKPVTDSKLVTVVFDSTVCRDMPWEFRPTQHSLKIVPGETALAFYTVKNKANYPITGVATYNVQPPQIGQYFNKIQCFCFEEQRLEVSYP
jgi:cytochrome c oxidase assembly protein subunit 11